VRVIGVTGRNLAVPAGEEGGEQEGGMAKGRRSLIEFLNPDTTIREKWEVRGNPEITFNRKRMRRS